MHSPTLFSSTQWKLHCPTAFPVFSIFGLFFILQQFIVILNVKEKEGPMGHGAANAPLTTLMRWGKGSWCGTSGDEKHLFPTPQWVELWHFTAEYSLSILQQRSSHPPANV